MFGRRWISALAVALGFLVLTAADASAMPACARRYCVSGQPCHHPFPKLNDFGACSPPMAEE